MKRDEECSAVGGLRVVGWRVTLSVTNFLAGRGVAESMRLEDRLWCVSLSRPDSCARKIEMGEWMDDQASERLNVTVRCDAYMH